MADWEGTAAILLSLHDAMNGSFRRLRSEITDEFAPEGPVLRIVNGFDGTGGAAADVSITATHADGRQLSWLVQIWIDRHDGDETWCVTVKGEIDLDDEEGDDYCVLNEQRTVNDGRQAAAAIDELTAMVVDYPLEHLLAMRWSPGEHDPGGESFELIGPVVESVVETAAVHSERRRTQPPR